MSKTLKISSSHFYSIFKFLSSLKNKERVFISNATHVSEILSFHHDRLNDLDLFITFNIDRFATKFLKNSFYKKIIEFLGLKNDQISFVLYNCSTKNTLDLLKLIFPNCSIYLKYVDIIDDILHNKNELRSILNASTHADTYSQKDAKEYNIDYVPNIVNKQRLSSLMLNQSHDDGAFLFVGLYSASRFAYLLKLLESYNINNIKYKFLILIESKPENTDVIHKITEINKTLSYEPFTILKEPISYTMYLTEFAKAAGIIDFYRLASDEGYSYRVLECIATNKKLITNRNLYRESFYLKDLIFNIDKDNINDFNTFIKSDSSFNQEAIKQLQTYLYDRYLPN